MTETAVRGVFNTNEPLPGTVAQLTREWFAEALDQNVRDVSIVEEIHATASKIIVKLTVDDEQGVQQTVRRCVKGGFNLDLLAIHRALYETHRREAEFYYNIAPTANMRLPQAYFAGTDLDPGQGLVVMEDLTVQGCTFGNPLNPWPAERVFSGVRELAALHARTWGAPANEFPWLHASGNPLHAILRSLFNPEAWAVRFAEGERPPVPDYMIDQERMLNAFTKMWETVNPKHRCAIHGDPHLGNTFITPAGEPGFIDWQGLSIGSAFHDVAYFISGSLTTEDRQEHERDLVTHYIKSLREYGPELEWTEAWEEYRKHLLHGFAWAIAAPGMQPREVIFTMTARHVAAIVDHNSLELVESML